MSRILEIFTITVGMLFLGSLLAWALSSADENCRNSNKTYEDYRFCMNI